MTDKDKAVAIIRFFISDVVKQVTNMARMLRKYYVGSKVYLYLSPQGDLLYSLSYWRDDLYYIGTIKPHRCLDRLDIFKKVKMTITSDVDDLQKKLQ